MGFGGITGGPNVTTASGMGDGSLGLGAVGGLHTTTAGGIGGGSLGLGAVGGLNATTAGGIGGGSLGFGGITVGVNFAGGMGRDVLVLVEQREGPPYLELEGFGRDQVG